MTVVLVHGNPETDAVWDPLVEAIGRVDVVRLSPPGFGAPLPDDFPATYIAYRDWLEDELENIGEPVDLVGHDWGGGHVVNVVMHRPELVRSWASDIVGVFDPDYVWHDLAQVWQTPGDGEQLVETMMGAPLKERAAQLGALGLTPQVATKMAAGHGPEMGRAILIALPLGATAGHGRGWPGAGAGQSATGPFPTRHRRPLCRLGGDPSPGSRPCGRPYRSAGRTGALVDGPGSSARSSGPHPVLEIARLSSEPYPVHRVHGGTGQTAFGAGGPETVLPVAVPQFTEPLHWSSGRARLADGAGWRLRRGR